ncbi:MAG: flavin reductase family protein [Gammaproteobacteria bacterium]|nr:flavin reductase family protein [Gammaproteobacteria bacterium]
MTEQFDLKQFRNVLGSFMTGVTVVTARTPDGERIGFTANSFTSLSLEPPLVLVCLADSSANYRAFRDNGSFAINILTDHQRDISNTFASPVADRFANLAVREERTGSPIIEDCLAWLDCEMHETVDGGDHVILIGRVVGFGSADHNPLGYFRGSYFDIGLNKDAAIAAEEGARGTTVGALLESEGRILLLQNDRGALELPAAAHLGGDDGLLAQLGDMGLSAEIGFIFSVFEDEDLGGTYTCYRGSVEGELNSDRAQWVGLDDIPYDKIDDSALRTMVQRYAEESQADAFGVYLDDRDSG